MKQMIGAWPLRVSNLSASKFKDSDHCTKINLQATLIYPTLIYKKRYETEMTIDFTYKWFSYTKLDLQIKWLIRTTFNPDKIDLEQKCPD